MQLPKFPECLECANLEEEESCEECNAGEFFEPNSEELDFDEDRSR